MKKIICKETGKIYDSIADATVAMGANRLASNIRVALTDNKRSNKAFNFTWYYIDSIEAETILRHQEDK